jgi:hypothetical protein
MTGTRGKFLVSTLPFCDGRHQMFVNMVRKSETGSVSCHAVTEPPPAALQNLTPIEVRNVQIPEPSPHSPPSTTACGEDGVAHVSQESVGGDGFGERVVGKEAIIEFEHKVVARLRCGEGTGEPVLNMDPLLKGKIFFPIEGLMLSMERAKQLLIGTEQ